jgi:hypothetical protein
VTVVAVAGLADLVVAAVVAVAPEVAGKILLYIIN